MPSIPFNAAVLPTVAAAAAKTPATSITFISRAVEDHGAYVGESARDRTIYTIVSLFFIMVLAGMLGSRFTKLRRSIVRGNITSILVLLMYTFVMLFIACASVLLQGQGLYNYNLCFAAMWLCLISYTLPKLIIYTFLVERIHVVRAPFIPRNKDKLYISCLVLMTLSLGSVAINTFSSPIITMVPEDGRCRIGIPGRASIPFMVMDIVVDVALTSVFVYLLRPVVQVHFLSKFLAAVGLRTMPTSEVEAEMNDTVVQKNIRKLLRKSLIGGLLIMIPTVANMVQFYVMNGKELALICLTICTFDVSWDVIVLHWLTSGSSRHDASSTRGMRSFDIQLEGRRTFSSHGACTECKARSTMSLPTLVSPTFSTTEELSGSPQLSPATSHKLSVPFACEAHPADFIVINAKGTK